MSDPSLDQVDWFSTAANPVEARWYAQLQLPAAASGAPENDSWRLAGRVVGPRCRYSRTLPARVPLADRGPGRSLLAEAVLVDPCWWTPELPFLYDVELELWHADQRVQQARRVVGLPAVGVRGNSFTLQGKPWVPRGMWQAWGDDLAATVWHDRGVVAVCSGIDSTVLDDASEAGCALIVELTGGDVATGVLPANLRRLARCPAVALVALPRDTTLTDEARTAARGLILAGVSTPGDRAVPATWECAVWARFEDADELVARMAGISVPIVATQQLRASITLAEARAACDRVQAQLAGRGVWAGYAVC